MVREELPKDYDEMVELIGKAMDFMTTPDGKQMIRNSFDSIPSRLEFIKRTGGEAYKKGKIHKFIP